MATYRYLLGDLLSNTISLELPLFGVTYSRRLNLPGNCTFSTNLGNAGFSDQEIIDSSIPGRSTLWIERDGALVWGGIIWSRVYQSQAAVLSYTAQTFESFFYKQFIESHISYAGLDQRQFLVNLITNMQAKEGANISIVLPGSFVDPNIIPRSMTFYNYMAWSYGKAIEYLINYADGFDYTIDVAYDGSGNTVKTLTTDNKLGQPITTTQVAFDYPGNIKNYYYPESTANAAVSVLGFGAGETTLRTRSKYVNPNYLNAGWPDLQLDYSNADVTVQATLDSQTQAQAINSAPPMTVPTFEVNPNLEPSFGSYSLGDYARIHIEDLRFPDGKEIISRIIGYDAKPPSSEGQEEVKLVVAGETI